MKSRRWQEENTGTVAPGAGRLVVEFYALPALTGRAPRTAGPRGNAAAEWTNPACRRPTRATCWVHSTGTIRGSGADQTEGSYQIGNTDPWLDSTNQGPSPAGVTRPSTGERR